MAVNFPSTPSDGQTYTLGNQTWTYNAARGKWVSANDAPIIVSATAPTGKPGRLWYDTNDGSLMIYTGAAWVQALGYTIPSNALRTADIGSSVLAYDAGILTSDQLDTVAGRGFYFYPARAVAVTSGTSVGWENLPPWITQFDIGGLTISPDAPASPTIQIGSAVDGFKLTGYSGGADQLSTGSFGNPDVEDGGLQIRGGLDVDTSEFYASFVRVSEAEHIWIGTITGRLTNAALIIPGATVMQLSGPLDRVRVSASTLFDTGTIYARYR